MLQDCCCRKYDETRQLLADNEGGGGGVWHGRRKHATAKAFRRRTWEAFFAYSVYRFLSLYVFNIIMCESMQGAVVASEEMVKLFWFRFFFAACLFLLGGTTSVVRRTLSAHEGVLPAMSL